MKIVQEVLESSKIRRTADGRISVFDALKEAGAVNPRETWKRLSDAYPDILEFCDSVKLTRSDGKRANAATPVTNQAGWRRILMVLPGVIGKQYRIEVARLVDAWFERPADVAAAAMERITDPKDLKRLETRAKSKRSALTLSGAVLAAGASKKALARVHDVNNVAITGHTAEERKADTGLRLHRDGMSESQLAAMHLIQTLESELIENKGIVGDGGVIGAALEVTGDMKPMLQKYFGDRKGPRGGMLQVAQ